MVRRVSKSLSLAIALTATVFASGHQVHWGYEGDGAPENWGNLAPEFRMCKDGVNQSPINLTGFVDAKLPEVQYSYETKSTEVLNNGHAVQVNVAPGSKINVDGIDFEAKAVPFPYT